MSGYLLRRLAASIPTLLALVGAVFLLLQCVPGDPADARGAHQSAFPVDRAAVESLRRQFGLDRPLWEQSLDWTARCLRFDFGASFADGRPVGEKIGRAIVATAALNGSALLLIVSLSLLIGVWMAIRAGRTIETWTGRALGLLAGLPVAWGALLLQRALAVDLGLLPLLGAGPAGAAQEQAASTLSPLYLLLPALAASYRGVALYARLVRQAVLEALSAAHVITARARGAAGRELHLRHTLRNAALPLISAAAALAPAVIAGNVVVESVFAWPGVGRLFVEALLWRDYAVLLALVWCSALFTWGSVLLGDLLISCADPRVPAARGLGQGWR